MMFRRAGTRVAASALALHGVGREHVQDDLPCAVDLSQYEDLAVAVDHLLAVFDDGGATALDYLGPLHLDPLSRHSIAGNTVPRHSPKPMRGRPPVRDPVTPVFRPYDEAGVLRSPGRVGWYNRL